MLKTRFFAGLAAGLFVLAVFLILFQSPFQSPFQSLFESEAEREGSERSVIVETTEGPVAGIALENSVHAFKGIPYALAPIGTLRWQPPQNPVPRDRLLKATAFAPACPQSQYTQDWYRDVASYFGHPPEVVGALENVAEDCLFLNIWTQNKPQNKKNAPQQQNKPVMVWIHGGSNISGYAHEPNYAGHHFAAQGVVLVTINYRMGPLGFMAHPLLDAQDPSGASGNYGLMDIVQALHWLKANIAAFGGDPDNVTVMGESAGGANIKSLFQVKQAQGLFHKAIIQSGALGPFDNVSKERALAYGSQFMDALGLSDIEDMRQMSWQALDNQRAAMSGAYYHAPVTDNIYLFDPARFFNPVPLIIGSNLDEWRMYLPEDVEADFNANLDSYYNASKTEAASWFTQNHPDPVTRADRVITAAEFLCPSVSMAGKMRQAGQPGYVYLFTRERQGGAALGAYHGAEIPYVFKTHDTWLPVTQKDIELSDMMMRYWINFAMAENPNGDGLPGWQIFDLTDRPYLDLGDMTGTHKNLGVPFCSYLDPSLTN